MIKRYSTNILLLLAVLILSSFCAHSQQITLSAHQQPLNSVLYQLRDEYQVQLSFSEKLVKKCTVNASGTFSSPEAAISQLLKSCDLSYKVINHVFVIFQERKKEPTSKQPLEAKIKSPKYLFRIKVFDVENEESLPYAHLLINSSRIEGDVNGNFMYQASQPKVTISISHLGYYKLDSVLEFHSKTHFIALNPATIQMEEVVMESYITEVQTVNIEKKPGHIKLNHKVAHFLPGNSNNTLFNLLRLQPGVLAAGEPSNDYHIWGSYKGQTQVLFDGITIFNTSSLDDRIGAFNPMMIKDIEIHKAGYGVDIGDRVGGVVNITGTDGNVNKFRSEIHVSNQLFGNYYNIPIRKQSSLQIAYRISYPDLFSPETYIRKFNQQSFFADGNIKYTTIFNSGDEFRLSLLGNTDQFSTDRSDRNFERDFADIRETHRFQIGGSLFYSRKWKKAGTTSATLAYSMMNADHSRYLKFKKEQLPDDPVEINNFTEDDISELSLKLDHQVPLGQRQQLSFGWWNTWNRSGFIQDSVKETFRNSTESLTRMTFYVKDNLSLTKYLNLEPGVRADIPLNGTRPFLQPRINAIVSPNDNWRVNLAAGSYTQFINQYPVGDNLGNLLYFWNISDNYSVKTLRGAHFVSGLSHTIKYFTWSVEGYYKTIQNLNEFSRDFEDKEFDVKIGKGRTYGLDLYAKAEFNKHMLWVSYSLSKTEEQFFQQGPDRWKSAPQDQRHELKAACLLNFNPFFTSANYVFGSGFQNTNYYSRLDLAFMYRHTAAKMTLETGLSFLNVTNTKNEKYNGFSRFPGNREIFTGGIPFTPNVFLRMMF